MTMPIGTAPPAGTIEYAERNRKRNRPEWTSRAELLAPAGNYECFLAAIHAGADAVYLAGKQFGARAAADNFSESELISAIRYAHLFRRRVYMTVNTLLKDDELDGLAGYLCPYVEAGLDAVIVQDFGVLSVIKKAFPHLAIHCSTQMTITDEWGVRLAEELGAVRVVPARELSIAEIRQMKQACPAIELECFVHGAMCYCYSGQCLMSSMIGGRSGNRGACAQPCRLPYDVELHGFNTEESYPLSLKDLCAVRLIPELLEAGIDSFKIEGRMKNAEYCAGVTAVYRAVMDRFFAGGKAAQGVTKEELSLLRGLYVRSEIGDGYYHCQSGGHMLTQGKPGYRGCDESVLSALRTRYLEKKPAIPVEMALSLTVGNKAHLTVRCGEAEAVCSGGTVQAAAKKPLTEDEIRRRLQKTGGTPFTVTELQISMTEAVFLPVGQLNELRREALGRLEEQMILRYQWDSDGVKEQRQRDGTVSAEDRADVESVQRVNEAHSGQIMHSGKAMMLRQAGDTRGYLAVVDTAEQLAVCAAHPLLQGICVPVNLYEAYWRENGTAMLASQRNRREKAQPKAYYLYLPRILRSKDTRRVETAIRALSESGAPIAGIYVHTAGEYRYAAALAETLGKRPQEFLFGSPFLYCMNAESARFWQTRVRAVSVPYELCERELRVLFQKAGQAGVSGLEMPIYGHIPMMVTANCIVRSFDKRRCPQPDGQIRLKDRTGQRMHVKTECGVCLNTIYNSVPLSMHKHMPKLQKRYEDGTLGAFTLSFTVESAARTKEVLDFYMHPTADIWTPGSYTNGHFQRGVV